MAPAVEAFTTNNKVIRQDLVVANVLILMSVATGHVSCERRGFEPRSDSLTLIKCLYIFFGTFTSTIIMSNITMSTSPLQRLLAHEYG